MQPARCVLLATLLLLLLRAVLTSLVRSLYVSLQIQSYAGKYVPAISYYIHKKNPTAKVKINLVGMAIGDGLCDPEVVRVTFTRRVGCSRALEKDD